LREETLELGKRDDRLIQTGVATGHVRAERDEVALFFVRRQQAAEPRRGARVLGWHDLIHHARHRTGDVDGRVLPARRERALEHHVPVEDATHLVGDRLVQIAPLHEHRVHGGDRAALPLPAALEQARQQGEDARRVAATRGRLPRREPDLPLGARDARDRIEQQEHALALVAKALGDRGRHLRGAQPLDGGGVARRHHDDRSPTPLGAQRTFEELRHLAPALADEADDDDVRRRTARDRAEQGALADPRAREEPHALADAEGEQCVDRPDPGDERRAYRPARERGGRVAIHGCATGGQRRRQRVEGAPEAVEDSPEERRPHADLEPAPGRLDYIVGPHARQLPERKGERLRRVEPDDLRRQLTPGAAHPNQIPDSGTRQGYPQQHAGSRQDAPHGAKRGCGGKLRPERLEVHALILAVLTAGCHAFVVLMLRVALVGLMAFGCHGSVQADANASTSGEADAELDAEVQKERAAAAAAEGTKPDQKPEAQAAADTKRPLLGARSDLTLASAQAQTGAQCSCLRVALGAANLGAFRWTAETPAVDDQTQLVLALSSEGSGCTDPKGSVGASYWGYRRSGDDVVVYVENGVKGRPLAAGAIIPKPVGTGQVYVAPAKKGVVYGKATDGKGNCKVGNPGPLRTIPVTPDEMGAGSVAPGGEPALGEDLLTGR